MVTQAMIEAGIEALAAYDPRVTLEAEAVEQIYRDMAALAPHDAQKI
jgi:phage baseplate assembly protein W